jgi:hypothetical protein
MNRELQQMPKLQRLSAYATSLSELASVARKTSLQIDFATQILRLISMNPLPFLCIRDQLKSQRPMIARIR